MTKSELMFDKRMKTVFADKAMPFIYRFDLYVKIEVEFASRGCKKLMLQGMKLAFVNAFNNYIEMVVVITEYVMQYGEESKNTSYYKFMIEHAAIYKQVMLN